MEFYGVSDVYSENGVETQSRFPKKRKFTGIRYSSSAWKG